MAENSGFFASVGGDRKYNMDFLARWIASIISNGTYNGELAVTADGSAMTVTLPAGRAWINGYYYRNDGDMTLAIDNADGVLNRKDIVVLRWDVNARSITAQVIKGSPASSPIAPQITRTVEQYDLKLAEISIPAGTTAITQSLITDTRLDNDVCGIVTGVVDQVDTTTLYAQIQDDLARFRSVNEADFTAWVNGLKDILDDETAGNLLNLITEHKADTNNPHQTTPEQIGAVQGNTAAWATTDAGIGDAWNTILVIPGFEFSEGCQVTFKAPQTPTDSEPVWANRIQIFREAGGAVIGEYALSTLSKEPVSSDAWAVGAMVTVTLSSEIVGTWSNLPTAFFKGGAPSVPSIFGTGADGDAVISGTVTLPVEVPHQSIVEKNYKSLIINPGAILKCAAWNAGLILRVKGDCTIHGTIDQSGMAPKTNPQNNYPYPAQLVCGDGGNGATAAYGGYGGTAMLKRAYGGGYGAGGAGGNGASTNDGEGGWGGDSTSCTIDVANIFSGGASGRPVGYNGAYGGGGGAGDGALDGGDGGTGGGGNGDNGVNSSLNSSPGGGGGGAGNYGGGVILLFVAGNLLIDGAIKCNGLNGGNGGTAGTSAYGTGHDGSGGGGGGGGAIYILYRGAYTNTGLLQVNGGQAGTGQTTGTAGGVGSITVIQGDK